MAPFHIVGQRVLPSARIGIALAGGPEATRESLLSKVGAAGTMPGQTATTCGRPGMHDLISRFEVELRDAPCPRPAHRFLSAQNLALKRSRRWYAGAI